MPEQHCPPPRHALRVKYWGPADTDLVQVASDGTYIVWPSDAAYEAEYLLATYYHKWHGHPMPYAEESVPAGDR